MKTKRPAREHSGGVIRIGSQSSLFIRRGDEKADRGDYIGALKMYRRALACVDEDSPEGRDILLSIADTYLDMNCASEAMNACAPLLRPDTDEFRPALLRLGHCLASRGELESALDSFRLSLAADGIDTVPLSYEDSMNAVEAADFCEDYLLNELKKEPIFRDVDEIEAERIADSASVLSEKADFDGAIAMLLPAHEKYPASERIFTDLLLDHYCDQRYSEGLALYDAAQEKLKNDFTVVCCAAMLCHQLGLTERERAEAERISAFTLTEPQEIVRAFTVMMEIGLYERALEYADMLLSQEPYNRNFLHFHAHAAYKYGHTEQAKSDYELCLLIEPYDSAAHYYRAACVKTLETGEAQTINIDYAVPHGEFLERCVYTQSLLSMNRDDLAEHWKTNSDKVLMMTDWALNDRNCPFGDLYMVFLMMMDRRRAEALLRRLLVEPNTTETMRSLCANHLQALFESEGAQPYFVMFNGGRIRICQVRESVDVSTLPACYRYIITSVGETLQKTAPELVSAGIGIAKLYAAENRAMHPQLPYGQKEAMAAAIVYSLLEHSPDHETPDKHVFSAAQGITPKRLDNAMERLNALYKMISTRNEAADTPDDDGDE